MSVVEDLGDSLALSTLEAMEYIDDDRFYEKVGRVIEASSPTLLEAYMTAIRVRLAERRARVFLEKALAAVQTTTAGGH